MKEGPQIEVLGNSDLDLYRLRMRGWGLILMLSGPCHHDLACTQVLVGGDGPHGGQLRMRNRG
jgi:hypothetical protein